MFEKYQLRWTALWLSIAWLLVAAVIVLSLVRLGARPPTAHSDKFGHILAYTTLMFWFGQIYSQARTRLFIAVALALMGVALEIAQGYHRLPQLRICRHGRECDRRRARLARSGRRAPQTYYSSSNDGSLSVSGGL